MPLSTSIASYRLLRPRLETAAPAILEEDMPTLLDGLIVQLLLNSDYFRGKVCAAFRRASEADSAMDLLMQLIEWMRDELRQLERNPVRFEHSRY